MTNEQEWKEDVLITFTFPKKGDKGKEYVALFKKQSKDGGSQFNNWMLMDGDILKQILATVKGSEVKYKTEKAKDKDGNWKDRIVAYEVTKMAQRQFGNKGISQAELKLKAFGLILEAQRYIGSDFNNDGTPLGIKEFQAQADELLSWAVKKNDR